MEGRSFCIAIRSSQQHPFCLNIKSHRILRWSLCPVWLPVRTILCGVRESRRSTLVHGGGWPLLPCPSPFVRLGLPMGYGPQRLSTSSSGVQCTMQIRLTIPILCFLSLVVLSCGTPTEENLTEVKSGAYKVDIRSREFHHSGIRNVDICVADVTSSQFPTDKAQCFLHGFDFSGLAVKWASERNVEISFACGRVSRFSNFAAISRGRPLPVEFHATLTDECNAMTNRGAAPQ
jgi:hypothetical protein